MGGSMLLRSITQHVKDQNWFAVSIDFCIVVVGVFIGIQVANWNTSLANKLEEKKLNRDSWLSLSKSNLN